MNDLEQRLKDVLETDASKAPTVPSAPKGLKREVRRRQVGTALIGTVAIVAVLGVSLTGLRAIDRTEGTTTVDDPWADYEVFERTAQIEGFTITSPSDLYLVHQWPWAASVDAKLDDRRERRLEACGDLSTPEERRPCRAGLSGVPGDGWIIPVFMLSEHDYGLESSPCVDPSFAVAPDEAIMTIAWTRCTRPPTSEQVIVRSGPWPSTRQRLMIACRADLGPTCTSRRETCPSSPISRSAARSTPNDARA